MSGSKPNPIKYLNELNIVLASSSPQRHQILNELGVRHEGVISNCEEIVGLTPEDTVCENAKRKVLNVILSCPDRVVLAADTVLYADGRILDKPYSPQKVFQYLSIINGKKIKAFSAVAACLSSSNRGIVVLEWAGIKLRKLSKKTIEWYINSEEPLDCAGSLCISRYGEILVERIEGEYSCVAGLPKSALLLALSDPVLGESGLIVRDSEKKFLNSEYVSLRRYFNIP